MCVRVRACACLRACVRRCTHVRVCDRDRSRDRMQTCDRSTSQGSPQSREHAVSRSTSLHSARVRARARARVRYRVLCVRAFVCMCTSGCPSSPGPASESNVHATWLPWSEPRLLRVAGAAARAPTRVRTQAAKHTREDAHRHGASQRATARGGHGWAGSVIGTHARAHTGSRGTSRRAAAHAAPADGSTARAASSLVRLALRVLSAGARVRPGRDGVSTEARTWARRTLHDCGRPGKPGNVPITGSESDGPYFVLGSSANPRFAKV